MIWRPDSSSRAPWKRNTTGKDGHEHVPLLLAARRGGKNREKDSVQQTPKTKTHWMPGTGKRM